MLYLVYKFLIFEHNYNLLLLIELCLNENRFYHLDATFTQILLLIDFFLALQMRIESFIILHLCFQATKIDYKYFSNISTISLDNKTL